MQLTERQMNIRRNNGRSLPERGGAVCTDRGGYGGPPQACAGQASVTPLICEAEIVGRDKALQNCKRYYPALTNNRRKDNGSGLLQQRCY